MKFRINVIFSFVIHAAIFTAALALAGKDAVLRFPERFIMVTLFEHPAAQKTAPSGIEKKNEPVITAGRSVTRLREASPPEVPPTAQIHGKGPQVAVPQKNNPFEDGAGLTDSSADENHAATLQTGGFPGPSLGAMQLAIPGKTATQGSRGEGKNKTASGDRDVVNAIRASIERAKSYPPLARKRGIEGTATAEFTINSQGHPENIRIVRSSGSDMLDAAAKNTVLRASPFPFIKGGIEVPITFRIEKER